MHVDVTYPGAAQPLCLPGALIPHTPTLPARAHPHATVPCATCPRPRACSLPARCLPAPTRTLPAHTQPHAPGLRAAPAQLYSGSRPATAASGSPLQGTHAAAARLAGSIHGPDATLHTATSMFLSRPCVKGEPLASDLAPCTRPSTAQTSPALAPSRPGSPTHEAPLLSRAEAAHPEGGGAGGPDLATLCPPGHKRQLLDSAADLFLGLDTRNPPAMPAKAALQEWGALQELQGLGLGWDWGAEVEPQLERVAEALSLQETMDVIADVYRCKVRRPDYKCAHARMQAGPRVRYSCVCLCVLWVGTWSGG